ncbi:hypothetical protein LSAT2_030518 [Lamellibrachia satsuma]|nr:hypothetical protein LSAT2_030518 [Lamellibrachia satsuma]
MGEGLRLLIVSECGPINREMRNLISSLKNHNEQLKGEVTRYRRKLRETQMEVNKLHEMNRTAWRKLNMPQIQQHGQLKQPQQLPKQQSQQLPKQQSQQLPKQQPQQLQQLQKQQPQQRPQTLVAKCDLLKSEQQQLPATPQQQQQQQQQQKGQSQQQQQSQLSSEAQPQAKDKEDSPPTQLKQDEVPTLTRKESEEREREAEREKGKTDPEIIRELKVELKRSQDRERDLKLLLDTYKCLPKESRDKAQIQNISLKKRNMLGDK